MRKRDYSKMERIGISGNDNVFSHYIQRTIIAPDANLMNECLYAASRRDDGHATARASRSSPPSPARSLYRMSLCEASSARLSQPFKNESILKLSTELGEKVGPRLRESRLPTPSG